MVFVTTVLHPLRLTVEVTVVSFEFDTVDTLEYEVAFTTHTTRLHGGRVDGDMLVDAAVDALGLMDGMLLLG